MTSLKKAYDRRKNHFQLPFKSSTIHQNTEETWKGWEGLAWGGGLLPKEAAWMNKEGEQTPAGGIDLRGGLTVRRSCLLFSQNKE